MKAYPVKYKPFRDHRKTRCVNPHCGKWVDLSLEKVCPRCGKHALVRPGQKRCDSCRALLPADGGDPVCPLCGSKQRNYAELRGLDPENLTAFAHLLHQARPAMSLAECKQQCRSITRENPYRISFAGKPERLEPFIREWNALRGSAAACLARETSRRPVVLLRSYNRRHTAEHVRLLAEAAQKSSLSSLTFEEAAAILHDIHRTETPFRLQFVSGFDHIEAWISAWRKLGGTAVRSPERL